MEINNSPSEGIKLHCALSVDQKWLPRQKKSGLGMQLKITMYHPTIDPVHLYYLIEFMDVSNPFVSEKTAEKTAKYVRNIMIEMDIWTLKDWPEFNLCFDAALSLPIIKEFQKIGWKHADQSISTCEGHNTTNISKVVIERIGDYIKVKQWSCK